MVRYLFWMCVLCELELSFLQAVNAVGGRNRPIEKLKSRQSKLFSEAKMAVSILG